MPALKSYGLMGRGGSYDAHSVYVIEGFGILGQMEGKGGRGGGQYDITEVWIKGQLQGYCPWLLTAQWGGSEICSIVCNATLCTCR